ncbi:hypothetical protein [Streptomyces chartreusis]|uniref:hypothetical protein n=1 Tax=Streptomyces chartreusis TaxID=1969 RepID=UPI002E1951C5
MVAAAAGLVILTGCSNDSKTPAATPTTRSAPSSASSSPTPSPSTDPQAAEKAAALDAYSRFWAEQVKAYAKGDTKGTDFRRYAGAKALVSTETDLTDLRSKGIVTTGAPAHDAKVDTLDSARKVPSAQLTDCLDSTDWKFVYRKSGKPVAMPENRLIRYETKATAEKWGKQWRIVEVTPQQDAC